ncbi:uroporphyrinogen decarboxylase/cobalamine-independent methonine synthase family protein [Corynebacterium bouchesdurhonense]|uniref:methionine synthase n=1 Tax=Corynebacterium bouchesdurhonense TaxID=1720192 RepID=UPI000831EFDD|nr:methionine synthase [Corynebacterium bouchesdurhonense]
MTNPATTAPAASTAPAAPTAFGLGPLPGTDLVQAADVVLSESPLPHIPQLPDRGVGSDAVGRTAALLEIPVDRGPRGWRVATRHRGARDLMSRDLDTLEELWSGKVDRVKVQVTGPWTLAAEIEMPNGHRMITDPGALRDITDALGEAVGRHRVDVEKRIAPTVLQLDEPRLADVTAGTLAGATRYEEIAAVPEPWERLAPFGEFLLHAPLLIDAPWQTADLAQLTSPEDRDRVARLVDSGARLAIASVEPSWLWRYFEELQLDPGEARLDVWARPASNLREAASNLAEARQMADGLA